jgi:cytochrome c2
MTVSSYVFPLLILRLNTSRLAAAPERRRSRPQKQHPARWNWPPALRRVHGVEVKEVQLTNPLKAEWVAAGKAIYDMKCLACHKLTGEKLVGPGWLDVTKRRQPPENGYGYSEETKPMLMTSHGFVPWDDQHHISMSLTDGEQDGRWMFANANNTPARSPRGPEELPHGGNSGNPELPAVTTPRRLSPKTANTSWPAPASPYPWTTSPTWPSKPTRKTSAVRPLLSALIRKTAD